jgi:mycothiol synthase
MPRAAGSVEAVSGILSPMWESSASERMELVPSADRARAIALVASSLAGTEAVADLMAAEILRPRPFAGLLGAYSSSGALVAAIWVQDQGGGLASVWPPRTTDEASPLCARRLLAAADALLDRWGVKVAQSLLGSPPDDDAQLLAAHGYEFGANLLYLFVVCPSPAALAAPPAPTEQVEFEPWTLERAADFARVLQASYEATRDCPQLNGVRDAGEVLAGYRQASGDGPPPWWFVRVAGQDVGCLLMADFPSHEQMELAYIVRGARGHGLGRTIVREALRIARNAGRERVVLAVDADNAPALAVYRGWGFMACDRRQVYLRIAPRES